MPTLDEMVREFQADFNTVGADVAPLRQPLRQPRLQQQPQQQAEPTLDDMVRSFERDTARKQSLQSPVDLQGRPDPPEDKIGFWENIERGGWGGFFDKVTLGVKPLVEAASLFGTVKRFQEDRYNPTTKGGRERDTDRQKIIEYLEEQTEVAERGLTIGAKVGGILGEMLPFMAEFLLTGGASAIGKKAVSTAVRQLIIRVGGKAAARSLAGRAVPQLAGWVTAAGIRTALTPHRSLKDFIDRRMPDIQISPEGQLIFQEAEESPFMSAYKAIGNQFIEMASEESGAFLGTLAGKITSKILPKGAVTALNKLKNAWIGAGAGRTAQEFAKKMSTKVGFHGVLEEFGEERLGALMRVVAGIDEGEGTTFEKIGRALYPGNEQAFVELIAFSVPGVARGVAAQAFERKTSYTRKEFKELTGREKSSLAERTEAFEADQAEVAEVPPGEEITAPAVAPEPEVAPERFGVPETEIEALLAEQAAVDAAEGVTDAERIAREAGEVSPEVGVERPPEAGIRVRDVAEVEEAAPEVVVKGKVERPSTPKGLKKPLSMLSDAELESRSKKASPYHKTYLQEIAWRKQQAQPPTEAKPLKQPRKKAVAAKPVKRKPRVFDEEKEPVLTSKTARGVEVLGMAPRKGQKGKGITTDSLVFQIQEQADDGTETAIIFRDLTEQGEGFVKSLEKKGLFANFKIVMRGDHRDGVANPTQQLFDTKTDVVAKKPVLKQPRKVKAEKPVAEKGFGAKNTIVTKAEFEKLKAEEKADKPLKGKRGKGLRKGQVRVFTPKDFVRAGKFAVFYFEGGLREFQAWSARLIEIMGEPVKPHLEKLWAQAKKDVEAFEVPKKVPRKAKPAKKVEGTSKVAKALAEEIQTLTGDKTDLTREVIPNEQQMAAASKFLASNPAEAKEIVFGRTTTTEILTNALRGLYVKKMIAEGKGDEASEAFEIMHRGATEFGRESSVMQEFLKDPYSTISVASKVKGVRESRVAKKLRKIGRKKESTAAVIQKEVDRGVSKMEGLTQDQVEDLAKAEKLLDELEC